jgi:two-component sensor histidine kinase
MAGIAFSPLDRILVALHGFLRKHRLSAAVISYAAYASAILGFGGKLAISSNYLVILPVLAISIGYGLAGGLFAGLAGLPSNLLLFWILGRPDFSPASKSMAELAGIVVGLSFGYLSDYYRKLSLEMERRTEVEARLRRVIEEKDVLLREVHHRVKNNLNVMKSLVNLQMTRSSDPSFKKEAKVLLDRIYAISFVQELLYARSDLESIDLKAYLEALARNVASGLSSVDLVFEARIGPAPRASIDLAIPLGLIANEVLTNALKHAFPPGPPVDPGRRARVEMSFSAEGGICRLAISDNGPGFDPDAAESAGGLGIKLIESLSGQLGARFAYSFGQGTRFELNFPLDKEHAGHAGDR